ncbi:MAG: ornithine carbamoyltransferase [Actinomycetota bacterium]|jgi:ornithine carbamoyltransferase|nr:ornithine carbamoyltransferase [Actinomycetota bacterium]
MSPRHVRDVDDLGQVGLERVLELAERTDPSTPLAGRGVALVFEKPSARTRSATEMAVVALGGHPVYIQGPEVGIDVREPAEDVARTLACYHRVIGARVMDHRTLERMAAALDAAGSDVPVVNLLSDLAHPGQAVADLLTMRRVLGREDLAGVVVAYVGDANNVLRSLASAGVMVGMEIRVASPGGYGVREEELRRLQTLASRTGGGTVSVTDDPYRAVAGADVVYTDVWTSMGQEGESEERRRAFARFTVDEALMSAARPGAVVMHCLPAHRGEEITAAVVDGPQSVVWVQAAARMAAMRGLLAWVLGAPGGEG